MSDRILSSVSGISVTRVTQLVAPVSAVSVESIDLNGEVAALYDSLAPGMLRFATVLSRRSEVASDVVQEAFLRYFLARRNGATIENPRSWLFGMLQNCLVDLAARSDEQPSVPIEGLRSTAPSFDPAGKIDLLELGSQLASALTEKELTCLLMRAEGLRYREIADSLHLRMGTIGAFLNRAVRKAKAALGKDYSR